MNLLLNEIVRCRVCEKHLIHGPRPILTADPSSKIVIVGQAPGLAVHKSGIPWDDKSGDTLRSWLNLDKNIFYNPKAIAIMPMGFCYPGKGKSGDLPPRAECAPLWHHKLLDCMPEVTLTLLIGRYAQLHYLGDRNKSTLTETVMNFKNYLPNFFVLPHPSPRNNIWQTKNKWFSEIVIPILRQKVAEALNQNA